MLSYIRIGCENIPQSASFYSAILTPLGYQKTEVHEGFEFELPASPGQTYPPVTIYLGLPQNGAMATFGNGSMIAFQAPTHAMVHTCHSAGLKAGGTDEGAPGFRANYSEHFYVSYLRDPVGNKIAIFCANPAEGRR